MKKRNVIGALVMAGAILLSVPVGTVCSFARLRGKILDDCYYYDNTGYAIFEGVDARVETARNALKLAERYVESDPGLRTYMDDVQYAVDLCDRYYVSDLNDVTGEVENNRLLGASTQALCERLEETALSGKDAKYPRQLLADMTSEQNKLERSNINDEIRAYNEKLRHFPAVFLAPLLGIREITPYGPGSGSRT